MKLVLTGGPSGGKTTFANLIQKEFNNKVVIVPEAASILYAGGFPRRPTLTNIEHRQRAIYFVQRELEGIVQDEFKNLLLVCDRGSLDGVAYWPKELPQSYLDSVGSELKAEIERYDWVLHLDTAPESHYDLTNPLRTEPFHEAWALNERIKEAWSAHPQRFIIDNRSGHFVDKLSRALTVVDLILQGQNYREIENALEARASSV